MKNPSAWNRPSGKIVEHTKASAVREQKLEVQFQLMTREREYSILPRQDPRVNDIKHQRLEHRIRSGTMYVRFTAQNLTNQSTHTS
jgi:hypothetical protein